MLCGTLRLCRGASVVKTCGFEKKIKNFVPASYFCSKSTNESEFKPIYRFPFISVGAALNKVKKLQVLLAGAAVPGSFVANAANLCDINTAISIAGVGCASTAAVCLVGQIFSNMIGFVYVSPDLQTVRFSYSDFWGNRKNVDFPREELIPLKHSASYPTDFLYSKVYRFSNDKPFKISLKGEILNTEAFKYIFKHCPE